MGTPTGPWPVPVLLDGLDEIARADDRLAVASWVERQIAAHAGDHFVLTARLHGLPGPLAAQADVFVVRPFTAEQVQLFLDRWYLAAERHATGASGVPRGARCGFGHVSPPPGSLPCSGSIRPCMTWRSIRCC